MATCVGIELTGSPLPLNHQNAFPLVLRPHTQDGGGPDARRRPRDPDRAAGPLGPALARSWCRSTIPTSAGCSATATATARPTAGFSGMFGHMDVIEVHPPALDLRRADDDVRGQDAMNNTILNWLQLLNQGKRIPGVVNTDAHYNFHGSGWLRNYVKSPTDDPARDQDARRRPRRRAGQPGDDQRARSWK